MVAKKLDTKAGTKQNRLFKVYGGAILLLAGVGAQPGLALTLEEVRAAMAARPDVQWNAAETLAPESFKGETNASPFGLDTRYPLPESTVTAEDIADAKDNLPERIDWRNKDGKNFVPPIRNQAFCGSCVAFAAVGTLETQLNISGNSAGLDIDLSEQDLFSRIGSCNRGSMPLLAVSSIKSKGVPDEACFPYIGGRNSEDPASSKACADRAKRAYKVKKTAHTGVKDAKKALQTGPIMTTMTVYEDLMFYKGGVYQHVTGDVAGGHAVSIIGYDDAEQAFIVRNSWGESWGEGGYFRIKYGDESGVGEDNYSIEVELPELTAKAAKPTFTTGMSGVGTVEIEKVWSGLASAFTGAQWQLVNKKTNAVALSGQVSASLLQPEIDTTKVGDGFYDFVVTGMMGTRAAARSWYNMVVIANKSQNITVGLAPSFDVTKPVKDRVYFNFTATANAVPLTHGEVHFKNIATGTERVVDVMNPGELSQVGWRTPVDGNGTYDVYAIGHIGTMQSFKSPTVRATVKND